MLKQIYVVEDVKAGNYHQPIYAISDGEMLRSFGDAANDKQTVIGQHPEDFRLWKIGTFNQITAEITLIDRLMLINAQQCVR